MSVVPIVGVQKLLPRIKIHAWGGFGSQLFACLVARRLKRAFPGRRVLLIFHTSGVTLRNLEIPSTFLSEFDYTILDDFVNERISNNGHSLLNMELIRDFLTTFLRWIGFLARLNRESEFSRLHSWVMDIRGHYTEINLSLEELNWISSRLKLIEKRGDAPNEFSIHFRLGDLLQLSMKTHVSIERLMSAIKSIHTEGKFNIYSDSTPLEVNALLKDSGMPDCFLIHNTPTIEVIEKCFFSNHFIGTNSKISLWISILRIVNGKTETTNVPIEISKQIEVLLRKITGIKKLRTY